MAASGFSIASCRSAHLQLCSKGEASKAPVSCLPSVSGLGLQRTGPTGKIPLKTFARLSQQPVIVKNSRGLHDGEGSMEYSCTSSLRCQRIGRKSVHERDNLCKDRLSRRETGSLCCKPRYVCSATGSRQEGGGDALRESGNERDGLVAMDITGVEGEREVDAKGGEVKGSLWGAMALITGTSVGAGILALPARTAEVGFVPSATAMFICWSLLMMEALLLAEVNVSLMVMKERQGDGGARFVSLRTMAQDTLGAWGGAAATVTYIFLSYTLLVAYIAKSADVIALITGLPREVAGVGFSALLGGLIFGGGPATVDCVNQKLIVALLGLFFLIVFGGATIVDWSSLQVMDWSATPQAIPVIFLALVYHDLVPVLCSYFGGDLKRIRQSIVLGSSMPFAMFLSWEAIALALKPLAPGDDPLLSLLTLGPGPALVIHTFSLIAVATSLLGCGLGLSEFILEQVDLHFRTLDCPKLPALKQPSSPEGAVSREAQAVLRAASGEAKVPDWLGAVLRPAERLMERLRPGGEVMVAPWRGLTASIEKFSAALGEGPAAREATKLVAYGLVLVPPLWVAMTTPDAFLRASDIAGAYGMTTLYGVFPPLMAWALFSGQSKDASSASQLSNTPRFPAKSPLQAALSSTFPGGRLALAGLGACACGVILMQAVIDSGDFSTTASMGEVILAAAETDLSGTDAESFATLICDTCNTLV